MLNRYASFAALVVLVFVSHAPVLAHEYEGKAVVATHPWARATPGGSTIGAAYVELSGTKSAQGDKLIGASSPVAGRIEIHTHLMEDGVMKMRKVDSVAVPSGEARKLSPGGDHLMMFDLKAPLKQGEVFPLTLKFETSGEITVDAVIESVGAMAPHEAGSGTQTDAVLGNKDVNEGSGPGTGAGSDHGADSGSHDGH
jgi:periplasmic copper chaperone A